MREDTNMEKNAESIVQAHLRGSISQKTFVAILVTALLLSATAIFVGYRVYADNMDQHYTDNTVRLARTAAGLLDTRAVDRCTGEVRAIYHSLTEEEKADPQEAYLAKFSYLEEDESWKFMRSQLQTISRENDLMSIMVINIERDDHAVVYVVDSDTTQTYCPPGTIDASMTDEELDNFARSIAVISNTEEYGWLSSGAATLCNEEGSIESMVVIDISMNDVMRDRHQFLFNYCLILLTAAAVLGALMTWNMRRQVVVPINRLAKAAEEYSYDQATAGGEGAAAVSHFANLNIRTGDELENLSTVMGEMEARLGEYIENLTRVTAEKERIGAERNIATQIQADMLPRIFPPFPGRKDMDIYATMNPAKEVGGDFYDFFLIDQDHLGLVMADVSGKGVPAALFMVIAKTLIKNRAQMGGGPGEILQYVNEQLCDGNDAELFVTVWFAILNLKTGKGVAVNAGHEHPVLRRAGGRYELIVYRHSPAVAVMPGMKFREHEFEMHPGDSLFVYTDGVPEATNAHDELFGGERMLAALNRDPDAAPETLLRNVRAELDVFVGQAPQFDDITMLGLRYVGSGAKSHA